jgi:hypothetical protein
MIDATDPAAQIENADAAEDMEKAEPTEPIEPIDRTEPIEPIDRTEPREPIDSSESCDQSDHLPVHEAGRTGTGYSDWCEPQLTDVTVPPGIAAIRSPVAIANTS